MSGDRAIPVIVASATMYAVVSIAVRALLMTGVPVEVTVLGRFAVSASALLLVPRALGVRSTAANRTRLRLFLLGAVFVGLQAMILFSALRMSSTAPVVFLFFTFPFWVAILSAVAGLERMTLAGIGSLLLVCAGAFLVVDPTGSTQSVGPFAAGLALAAAAMYAVFIVATAELLKNIDRIEGAGWAAAGATLMSAAATLLVADKGAPLDPSQLVLLGVTGILGTAALLGYFYALDRAGANVVALFGMWEPVMVAILAAALLNEALATVQVVGGIVVVAGLALRVARQGSLRRTRPDLPVVASPE